MNPTAEKHPIYGYWIVSDLINGYYVTKTYIGYTKREAIAAFKEEYGT